MENARQIAAFEYGFLRLQPVVWHDSRRNRFAHVVADNLIGTRVSILAIGGG